MAGDYIVLCELTVDNTTITDFKSVEESEVELAKAVKAMKKTGFGDLTPMYGVVVDYLVPSTGTPYNWETLRNGTLTIIDDGGRKTIYTGVCRLKVGAKRRDGENEMVQTITLGAKKKIS
jgi:hypothetical protein